MSQFEESEQLAIDEKRKRLHYEKIRLQEDSSEIETQLKICEQQEQQVDQQVYDDTQSQHQEKHRIENCVEEVNSQIEALEGQLKVLRKQKEMLLLE